MAKRDKKGKAVAGGAPIKCGPECGCQGTFGAGSLKHLVNHHLIHNGPFDYDKFQHTQDLADICAFPGTGEVLPVSEKDWFVSLDLASANHSKCCLVSDSNLVVPHCLLVTDSHYASWAPNQRVMQVL